VSNVNKLQKLPRDAMTIARTLCPFVYPSIYHIPVLR